MFDFVKTMEIAEKVCKATGKCEKCILFVDDDINFCFFGSMDNLVTDWNEIERRLIEWDKAHSEPKYPTWSEWQNENFPEASESMCPRMFLAAKETDCKKYPICSKRCADQTIPADIATKLGIKPKGEPSDDR